MTVTTLVAGSFSATVAEYGAPVNEGLSLASVIEITTAVVSVNEPESVAVRVNE